MRSTILICVALAVSGCAMETPNPEDIGTAAEDLSLLPGPYCGIAWSQIAVACVNPDHVVGTTAQCNLVCVPETAIEQSCNCRPYRWRWCRPGNICIYLAEGEAPPSTDYEVTAVRYWCDQTGICPARYWRIYPIY